MIVVATIIIVALGIMLGDGLELELCRFVRKRLCKKCFFVIAHIFSTN